VSKAHSFARLLHSLDLAHTLTHSRTFLPVRWLALAHIISHSLELALPPVGSHSLQLVRTRSLYSTFWRSTELAHTRTPVISNSLALARTRSLTLTRTSLRRPLARTIPHSPELDHTLYHSLAFAKAHSHSLALARSPVISQTPLHSLARWLSFAQTLYNSLIIFGTHWNSLTLSRIACHHVGSHSLTRSHSHTLSQVSPTLTHSPNN